MDGKANIHGAYTFGGNAGGSQTGGHDIQNGEESKMYTDITKSRAMMVGVFFSQINKKSLIFKTAAGYSF